MNLGLQEGCQSSRGPSADENRLVEAALDQQSIITSTNASNAINTSTTNTITTTSNNSSSSNIRMPSSEKVSY